MSDEKKKVISILRSLIISSPQKGKSQRDLVRDYFEFVGEKIPTFEFETVEKFLRGSGEFVLENFRGETIVYEKPNAESWHISKLVSEQGRTKKRAPVANRFRQPVRTPHLPPQRNGNTVVRSPPKAIFPKRNLSNSPRSSPVHQRSSPVQFAHQRSPSTNMENNSGLNRFRYNDGPASDPNRQIQSSQPNQTQPTPDLRNRINQIQQKKSTTFVDLTADDSNESTIRTNNNGPLSSQHQNPIVKQSPPIVPNKSESYGSQKDAQIVPAPTMHSETVSAPTLNSFVQPPTLTNSPFFDVSQPPPKIQANRIQDRLKNQPLTKNVNSERKSVMDRLVNARQTNGYSTVQMTPRESPVTQSIGSYERQLIQYCNENGCSTPIFRIFKVHDRFQCHVTVDNILYSSYPTDYGNQNEARQETAKHALERLNSVKNQYRYEVCLDSEVDLAIKIYDCIKDDFPTGVFSKKIPDKFLSLYSQVLPSDWINLLYKNPKYFTVEDCINDKIVCVVEAAELDQRMDKLKLPWEDEYWCLIITCTVSTAEIWGRLISKEHSNALDSLVVDIELELMKHKQIPKTFDIGQICLVLMSECAYRVRVERVDNSRRRCLCFFIDDGEQRWFEMNEMYVCQAKFLKFPPQAIRFALHGLEEFDENEFAKQHLEDTLLNSPPLIGQIFTKKEDFISQEESDDLVAVIQVVLYDTSTDDDVNLHPIIVEKICASIPAPELVHSKLTPVIVSEIADNGAIFVQLQQNGVHYVNKLIHKIMQPDVCTRPQTLPSTNSPNNKLFLVFDEAMHKWCRGELINEGKQENTMFLVDYGKTKNVPLSKIYRIESLSQALLTFPPQAIQVKLSGFHDFPGHLVSTLRGFFSGDTNAYVNKMNTASKIAEVNLYFVKDSNIVCVNDCLRSEQSHHEVPYSRQSSTTSNSSRDPRGQEEWSNLANLTLHSRKLPKFQPPEVGDFFNIEVVMTATPSNFQIRPIKYMPQWIHQMKSLQEYCRSSLETMQLNMLREGEAYACLHSDGSWYRAIVERHRDTKIFVSFCDIGEIDSIDNVAKLKVLPDEYRDLPKLAVTAKLFGIKPVSSDWEMDDIIEFNRLVSRKKFQAIVGKIIEKAKQDDNAVLEIQLIDVSNDDDLCINDRFVNSGRAITHFTQ